MNMPKLEEEEGGGKKAVSLKNTDVVYLPPPFGAKSL